jgi:uncharacterized repeat protein (TIGR02543 family)
LGDHVAARTSEPVAVTVTGDLTPPQAPIALYLMAAATYGKNAVAAPLRVVASAIDGGTVSYQWYLNTVDSNYGGTPITGETDPEFTPPTDTPGVYYYYAVITNTRTGTSGSQTATALSGVAAITVGGLIQNAQVPIIAANPSGSTYIHNDPATPLSVTAYVTDGGTVSYQWYINGDNNNQGGTPISGATSSTYTPSTSSTGTSFYYVVVTNTNNGADENTTATSVSGTATVTVNDPVLPPPLLVNALPPLVITDPLSMECTSGDPIGLTAEAISQDGGDITYQWFSNTNNSNYGGTPLGVTAETYNFTCTAGISYYYAVATNTTTVNGKPTADAASKVAVVIGDNLKYNAQVPVIEENPHSDNYTAGDPSTALSVTVDSPDGGTLSYKWYKDDDPTPVATTPTYTPPTSASGTDYYYVVVTNTNPSATGVDNASIQSGIAVIKVDDPKIDAGIPTITGQPDNATYYQNDPPTPLHVTAASTDGGTLTYQWFSNTDNSNHDGNPITGATSPDYTPPTDASGKTYYYVVVTNTNPSVNGRDNATAVSDAAVVVVGSPRTDAKPPEITGQPAGKTYTQGATPTPLGVAATSPDGGTLTYQWFTNTTNDSQGGTPIMGAIGSTYSPPTDTTGTAYYYAVVTNTNTGATGNQTAVRVTDPALIIVNPVKDAEIPQISTQPQDATYDEDDTPDNLSVTAASTDDGDLTYQWYENTTNSNQGGTPIPGATGDEFTPPTDEDATGTTYYYVVVTNTNDGATGSPTASIASDPAEVTVNGYQYTAYFYIDGSEDTTLRRSFTSSRNIQLNPVSKTGYTFNGWYLNNTGEPRVTYYISSNVKFYARWTPTGSGTQKVKAVFYDDGAQVALIEEYPGNYISLPTRTRKNYDFEGWKVGSADAVETFTEPYYSITADTDFYAGYTLSVTCVDVGDVQGLMDIELDLSGCYKLIDNISLAEAWDPLGDNKTNPFKGILEGNGKTVSGLYVSNKEYAGLFGYIDNGSRIGDLTVDIDPRGVSGTSYAGGVTGFAGAGKIVNAHITGTGTIISSGAHAGGIAGNMAGVMSGMTCNPDNYAIIFGSTNNVNVQSAQFAGGIAGETNRCSQINMSTNTGNISAANGAANGSVSVGGISGSGTGTITNSANSGAVSGSGSAYAYAGGVTGGNNGAKLNRSYNTGKINSVASAGDALAGGVAAYLRAGDYLYDVYNTADITATGNTAYAGGLAGSEFGGSVSRTYNIGNVTSAGTSTSGESHAGGIIGYVSGGSIDNSSAANAWLKSTSKNSKTTAATANRIMTHMNAANPSSVVNNFARDNMTINVTPSTLSSFIGTPKPIGDLETRTTYSNATSSGGLGWLFGRDDAAPWKWDTYSDTYSYPTLYWQTSAPLP